MIGLVLALLVVAVVISLFGGWIFGLALGLVAAILLIVFLFGFVRRTATREP